MNEMLPFIDGESEVFRKFFIEHMQYKLVIEKGKIVMLPPENMYGFLNKGRLKIFMTNELGNEKLMWFLEEKTLVPNDLSETFDKRMIAETSCEIIYVKKKDFVSFILADEQHLRMIIKQFYKRYSLCVQQQLNLNKENCRVKVYKFIYQIAQHYGKKMEHGHVLIEGLPSRNDIASITGVHRSNVTRYLSDLEKQDIIQKVKTDIIIKDLPALMQLIDQEMLLCD